MGSKTVGAGFVTYAIRRDSYSVNAWGNEFPQMGCERGFSPQRGVSRVRKVLKARIEEKVGRHSRSE